MRLRSAALRACTACAVYGVWGVQRGVAVWNGRAWVYNTRHCLARMYGSMLQSMPRVYPRAQTVRGDASAGGWQRETNGEAREQQGQGQTGRGSLRTDAGHLRHTHHRGLEGYLKSGLAGSYDSRPPRRANDSSSAADIVPRPLPSCASSNAVRCTGSHAAHHYAPVSTLALIGTLMSYTPLTLADVASLPPRTPRHDARELPRGGAGAPHAHCGAARAAHRGWGREHVVARCVPLPRAPPSIIFRTINLAELQVLRIGAMIAEEKCPLGLVLEVVDAFEVPDQKFNIAISPKRSADIAAFCHGVMALWRKDSISPRTLLGCFKKGQDLEQLGRHIITAADHRTRREHAQKVADTSERYHDKKHMERHKERVAAESLGWKSRRRSKLSTSQQPRPHYQGERGRMNLSPHAHHPAPPVGVWSGSNHRIQAPSRPQKHRRMRCTFLNRHPFSLPSWTLKPPLGCSTVAVPRGRHSSDEHAQAQGPPCRQRRCQWRAAHPTGCAHRRWDVAQRSRSVRVVIISVVQKKGMGSPLPAMNTVTAAWLATRRLRCQRWAGRGAVQTHSSTYEIPVPSSPALRKWASTGLGSITAKGFDGGGTARAPSPMASASDSTRDIEGMCLMAAGRRRRRL
ncbi:hypothetical protein GGX14DRAFT_392672 [Mycena pura]|uniref:Uncharacterized protein n=1 Tax=Mycena pura TaxID=153505 RepID=A0AAD6VIC9_9AGAR|nr:hypothetical protein GGX14DRAFT_392672 [Mycena pura]